MFASVWLLPLLFAALVLFVQLWLALGRSRAILVWFLGLGLVGGGWLTLEYGYRRENVPEPDRARVASVSSDACLKCHESHYESWHRSYHRTMTREATPEYVKGDFNDTTYSAFGITSRMRRVGDSFFMETADPAWATEMARSGKPPTEWGPAPLRRFSVDRLVGSHWFQEFMHKDSSGRYVRLPLSYHLVEGRWIHTNGAFLAPDTDYFWDKSTVWNETCLFCHNTRTSKRPWQSPFGERGYQSEVAELGISCEACHGPGGEHVRVNQNPARRLALHGSAAGDPTIVNPRRLPPERADQICGHCHGSLVPRVSAWDVKTATDPYIAGEDLMRSYFVFWSEAHQAQLNKEQRESAAPAPGPRDGRFWGDSTPLTTALEYQGMELSACSRQGHGKLSCLSCHDMHPPSPSPRPVGPASRAGPQAEAVPLGSRHLPEAEKRVRGPDFMLAPRMDSNEACYQCHASYRERLAEHTHHAADSSGSLCYNCHQAYQVYSLLTTHRSHRIERLRVRDSLGTGKPHACNLCHLDKSLGWTQDHLGKWYGVAPEPLPEEERQVASSVLHLCKSDARSRAVVAGAFSWPPARQASGTDWQGPLLARLLEHERYPAVRYLAHRGLRALYGGPAAEPYDYLAAPDERRRQLAPIRNRLEGSCRPTASQYPYLPLTGDGRLDAAALDRLLRQRNDPDVLIHE
jgi:hypothetical protein